MATMGTEFWSLLAGGAGTVLMVYAGASLLASRKQGNRGNSHTCEERRTLAEISSLWTGREPVVHFKDIARIWREAPQAAGMKRPRPAFRHPEIDTFFADWVENRQVLKGSKRAVVEAILSILDQEGDCPSVVRKNKSESDASLDQDVFTLLTTIPLWRHTLAVAQVMARKVTQEVLLPDALIVSLGHDLGKIPAHLDALYRTGDHPLVSLILLHRIQEFEVMPNREEISEAIRQHHLIKTDSPLAAALKEADRQVRLEEISRLTGPEPPSGSDASGKLEDTTAPGPKKSGGEVSGQRRKGGKAPGGEKRSQAPRAELDTVSDPLDSVSRPTEEESHEQRASAWGEGGVPSWFDPDAILAGLLGRVNELRRGRWSVVSSPEGLVFAQPDALWAEVKKLAGKDPRVLAADGDATGKRALLLLVVREMSRQRKAIATEFVADGHYVTQCVIVMESDRTLQVPLVPFRVEAFGLPPSVLETRKVNELQKMVRIIKPKQVHGGGGSCGVFD
jgi:hypothetical protein